MKKIYTITFHKANNYGAILQAYALQRFLSKKYDTKILNYDNRAISNCYKRFTFYNNTGAKMALGLVKDLINLRKTSKRTHSFNRFRSELKISDCYTLSAVKSGEYPQVDAYIVGSDQVWNHTITGGVDDVYSLNFGRGDFKKISYAASSGNADVYLEKKEYFKTYDAVSVRERSLEDTISRQGIKGVKLVADPTILLTLDEWKSVIPGKRIVAGKYLFAYSVGNATELYYEAVNSIARERNLEVVFFDKWNKGGKIRAKNHSMYCAGPYEFLNLLYNSEIVVTTSFHGTALSAILNKEMIIIPSTYSERITTLTGILGLSGKIVADGKKLEEACKRAIDWGAVNDKLEKERNKSSKWLIGAIEAKR